MKRRHKRINPSAAVDAISKNAKRWKRRAAFYRAQGDEKQARECEEHQKRCEKHAERFLR